MGNNEPTNIIVTKKSEKAVVSLVLSLLSVYGVGSILGIIFGHIARSDIKKSNGRLTGDGLALAGLIIGYATLCLVAIGLILALTLPSFAQYIS